MRDSNAGAQSNRASSASAIIAAWLCLVAIAITPVGSHAAALEEETTEQLRALGYVDSAPTSNPQLRGVTTHEAAASDGLSLYSSRHTPNAHLVDMTGEVIHSWTDSRRAAWMHVELQQDGSLLAIAKDKWLVKVDWDSSVRWRRITRAHHDLALGPNGRIYLLSRDAIRHEVGGGALPLLADKIEILAPDGKLERTVPLLPRLIRFVPKRRLSRLRRAAARGTPDERLTRPESLGDVTHTNSVEVIARAIPDIAPAGSILLSVREINRIVILDPSAARLLWSWGDKELQKQHHASLLDNGNILVFDNGTRRKRSRVIEVDPRAGKTVWSYSSPNLYTDLRGAAQKLPNGNVLATESDSGHVIEVTPKGRIVWEYWNPNVRGKDTPERDAIYRMRRYPRDYLTRPLASRSNARE